MNSKIVLENGCEYVAIDKIKKDNVDYIYLVNSKDDEDFCIRKQIIQDNKNYLVGLDNDLEFEMALKIYYDKNKINS